MSPSSSSRGPRWARRTGSRTRPWNKPNTTVRTNTLNSKECVKYIGLTCVMTRHGEGSFMGWINFGQLLLGGRNGIGRVCQLLIENIVATHSYLKKVTKTWEVEKPSRMSAIRVVTPPLRTAGPVLQHLDRFFYQFHFLISNHQSMIISSSLRNLL